LLLLHCSRAEDTHELEKGLRDSWPRIGWAPNQVLLSSGLPRMGIVLPEPELHVTDRIAATPHEHVQADRGDVLANTGKQSPLNSPLRDVPAPACEDGRRAFGLEDPFVV
jgi:hypothetical protein